MSSYQLAQLNVARLLAPLDSPALAGFVANLGRVNALADAAPGFVWRLQTDDGDATAIRPFGDDMLVNLSVWEDVAALHAFVYGAEHVAVMRRRRAWFERLDAAYVVLWWVPRGHRPSLDEAGERLGRLRQHGPGPLAFDFRAAYPAPDGPTGACASRLDQPCPAS